MDLQQGLKVKRKAGEGGLIMGALVELEKAEAAALGSASRNTPVSPSLVTHMIGYAADDPTGASGTVPLAARRRGRVSAAQGLSARRAALYQRAYAGDRWHRFSR